MTSRLGILFMHFLARWPLAWVRAFGWAMGSLLYLLVFGRRRVALRNVELCFPQMGKAARRALVRRNFICFAQAWLDRGWVWHAPPSVLKRRLVLHGALHELEGNTPTILFAPHFYGMDAGGIALTLNVQRAYTSIYTPQPDPAIDTWIKEGRARFGDVQMLNRFDGIKPIVAGLRKGGALFLLPDMNFGPQESIFVPFFGVQAATVPSLSRFARLGRAKVVPIVARMTPTGYAAEVLPAWQDFPTDDVEADTARMNAELERYIATMPEQYYWVHKRFKTRPPGEAPLY
jgi:Kdo2-lipid IVA lauroyltransferase/acyltransferase